VSAKLGTVPVVSDSSTVQSVCGPTRLRLSELLHITDQTAHEVLGGRYGRLFPPDGVPTDDRWWVRLHLEDYVGIQLISGVPRARNRIARPLRIARSAEVAVRITPRIPLGRQTTTRPCTDAIERLWECCSHVLGGWFGVAMMGSVEPYGRVRCGD